MSNSSGSVGQGELDAIDAWDNEGGDPGRNSILRRDSVANGAPTVSSTGTPQYLNEIGVREIRIGARSFDCIGAMPPHDHPHIYLRMGEKPAVLCPYCSTTYVFDRRLRAGQTEPDGCFYLSSDERGGSLSDDETLGAAR